MSYLKDTLAHGLARHQAGQFAEAQTVYESLLSHSHNVRINGIALSRLADLHMRRERLGEAREAARRALSLDKDNGNALLKAAQIERQSGHADTGLKLLQSRSTHQLPPLLLEEMGLCWHALGDYRKAFLCFKEAKRRISFTDLDVNRGVLTRYMEALAQRFSEPETVSWTPTPPLHRPSPIFIIGFNESGISELGHLLNHHPKLSLAPEVSGIDRARQALSPKDPLELHSLSGDEIQKARSAYFDHMATRVQDDSIIIDALPMNALALAIIYRLFPNSLILRCVRHPCEAVLRTFFKTYDLNPVTCHFDRLERTATTYLATTAVSGAIESSLNIEVHPLRVEEFLAAPQETFSAIAKGIGVNDMTIDVPAMSSLDIWPKYRAEMSRWSPSLLERAEELGYPAK